MEDRFVLKKEAVVLDRQNGLAWQRTTSEEPMVWKDGFGYIDRLNETKFAGFDDWRYPTSDELATLILQEEDRNSGLYVSPLFASRRNCWASTEASHHRACYVDFYYGDVYIIEGNYANHYIRAVRTLQ
jgi:serine/threonine-protein kinase